MKKIFLLAVVLLILISPTVTKAAANWIWIHSDAYRTIWIDNNSIERGDYNHDFHAYFKTTFSEEGKKSFISSFRERFQFPREIYNMHEEIVLMFFKKSNGVKYISDMSRTYYDKNELVIAQYYRNEPDWNSILPDTIGEVQYNATWARVRGK